MELYHGSLEIVETPEIRLANRTLDYGMGSILRHRMNRLRIG